MEWYICYMEKIIIERYGKKLKTIWFKSVKWNIKKESKYTESVIKIELYASLYKSISITCHGFPCMCTLVFYLRFFSNILVFQYVNIFSPSLWHWQDLKYQEEMIRKERELLEAREKLTTFRKQRDADMHQDKVKSGKYFFKKLG